MHAHTAIMTDTIHILGFSPATVGMLLESIKGRYGSQVQIRVLPNLSLDSSVEYLVPGIETDILDWSEVGINSNIDQCVLGVYRPSVKEKVFRFFRDSVNFSVQYRNVLDTSVSIASTTSLGIGVFINPMVTVAQYSTLGDHVTVNRNCSIGHHTSVGRFVTINPGAHVAGNCVVEAGVTIGMGATVLDGVSVGEGSIIGAGSIVNKDIPAGVKAFGVPCKIISSI